MPLCTGSHDVHNFPGPSSRASAPLKRRASSQFRTSYQKRVKVEEEDKSKALQAIQRDLRRLAIEEERLVAKILLAEIQVRSCIPYNCQKI
jgi:hypothetical protein